MGNERPDETRSNGRPRGRRGREIEGLVRECWGYLLLGLPLFGGIVAATGRSLGTVTSALFGALFSAGCWLCTHLAGRVRLTPSRGRIDQLASPGLRRFVRNLLAPLIRADFRSRVLLHAAWLTAAVLVGFGGFGRLAPPVFRFVAHGDDALRVVQAQHLSLHDTAVADGWVQEKLADVDRLPWFPAVVAAGAALALGVLAAALLVRFILPERGVARELKAYLGPSSQPAGGFDLIAEAITAADAVARGTNPNIVAHLAPALDPASLLVAAHPARRNPGQIVSANDEAAIRHLAGFNRLTEVGTRVEQAVRTVVITGRPVGWSRYAPVVATGQRILAYAACIALLVMGLPRLVPALPPDMDRRLDRVEETLKQLRGDTAPPAEPGQTAGGSKTLEPAVKQGGADPKSDDRKADDPVVTVTLNAPETGLDGKYDVALPPNVTVGEKRAIQDAVNRYKNDPDVANAVRTVSEIQKNNGRPTPAQTDALILKAEGLVDRAKQEKQRAEEEYRKAAEKRAEAANSRSEAREAGYRADGLKKVAAGLGKIEQGVAKLTDPDPKVVEQGKQEIADGAKQVADAKQEQEATVGELTRQLDALAQEGTLTEEQKARARDAAGRAGAALEQIKQSGTVTPENRAAIAGAARTLQGLAPTDPKASDAATAAGAAPAVLQQIAGSATEVKQAEEAAKNPGTSPPPAAGDIGRKKEEAEGKADESRQEQGKKEEDATNADRDANRHEDEGNKADVNAEKLLIAAAILLSPIPDPVKILGIIKLISGLNFGSGGGKGGTKGKGEGNSGDKKGSQNGQPGGKENGKPDGPGGKPGAKDNPGGKTPGGTPPGGKTGEPAKNPGPKTGTPGKTPAGPPGTQGAVGKDPVPPGNPKAPAPGAGGPPGRGLPLMHIGQGNGDLALVPKPGGGFELRAGGARSSGEERVVATFPAGDSPPVPLALGANGGVLYAGKGGKLAVAQADGPPVPTNVTAADLGIDPAADSLTPYQRALAALIARHPKAVHILQVKAGGKQRDVFYAAEDKSRRVLLWLSEAEAAPAVRERRVSGLLADELEAVEGRTPAADVATALGVVLDRTAELPTDSSELAKRIPLLDRPDTGRLRMITTTPVGNGIDARHRIERMQADGSKTVVGELTERSFLGLLKNDLLVDAAASFLSGEATPKTPKVVPGKAARILAVRMEDGGVTSAVLEEGTPGTLVWVKAGESRDAVPYRAPADAFEEAYGKFRKEDADRYRIPALFNPAKFQPLDLYDTWVGHEVEKVREAFTLDGREFPPPAPELLFGEAERVGKSKK
jgi:hypothetical protein